MDQSDDIERVLDEAVRDALAARLTWRRLKRLHPYVSQAKPWIRQMADTLASYFAASKIFGASLVQREQELSTRRRDLEDATREHA